MNDLLIDLGNSRLKWAQSGPGCWSPGAALHRERDIVGLLNDIWSEPPAPQRVVMVSVATEQITAVLDGWIQDRWKLPIHRVHASAGQLGVVNSYRQPQMLGADRWVALLGVRGLTERACAVVDCGTAVTVDALSSDGVFVGGVIFPGLRMLRESLGTGTAGIGSRDGDDSDCLARATADGVAAGALFGLAGAIERILNEQERKLDEEMQVFVTGGDARLLMSRLSRSVIEVPDLVLKGLARVAETLIL